MHTRQARHSVVGQRWAEDARDGVCRWADGMEPGKMCRAGPAVTIIRRKRKRKQRTWKPSSSSPNYCDVYCWKLEAAFVFETCRTEFLDCTPEIICYPELSYLQFITTTTTTTMIQNLTLSLDRDHSPLGPLPGPGQGYQAQSGLIFVV